MSELRKVAIIGAGPAGYTIAGELLKAGGYEVDLYDKEDSIGGAIHTGIPDYRMPKAFLQKTYDQLVSQGAHFHFNENITPERFEELRKSHDRVAVAIGAQVENTFGFKTGKGLYAGLTLLYDLNIKKEQDSFKKYHKAIVWGGGNVAMDCARSLIRILPDVTIVYRRSLKEMPANQIEIKDAQKEGVKIAFLNNIKEILRDEDGNVCGADVVKMELGEMDESGRASCHEIKGSDFRMDADLVVMAIGQKVDFTTLDSQLKKEDNHMSSLQNVYITGDAYTGPKTIGSAVVDGRAVAKQIMESF